MEQTDVIVIGAGWSGLMACKFCLEENLTVKVLEKRNCLGGVWDFTSDPNIPTVMTTTEMTSSNSLTEMSDFPMPESMGDFPNHPQVRAYLEAYVDKFTLTPHLTFNTTVSQARKTHDKESGEARWVVSTEDGKSYVAKFLIVCSGLHQLPNDDLRRTTFADFSLVHHSGEIKERLPEHRDKTILIVGGGETSSDIALELVKDRYARRIYWSINQGQHFFRKRGKWLPPKLQQRFPALGNYFKLKAWDKGASARVVQLVTDYHKSKPGVRWACKFTTNYSLLAYDGHGIPEWKTNTPFFHMFLNKSAEILDYIDYDQVIPKPGIRHCTGRAVSFVDGTSAEIDAVVLCTGYHADFPFLPPNLSQPTLDDRYKFVWDVQDSTIAFVGFVRPMVGSIPALAEMQARWAARVFSGRVKLAPPAERTDITTQDKQWWADYFGTTSRRIRGLVEGVKYMDDLAALCDSSPNYKGLLRRDPIKWFWAVTSPMNSCHYLLNDPAMDEQNLRTLRRHRPKWALEPLLGALALLVIRLLHFDDFLDWLGTLKYQRQRDQHNIKQSQTVPSLKTQYSNAKSDPRND